MNIFFKVLVVFIVVALTSFSFDCIYDELSFNTFYDLLEDVLFAVVIISYSYVFGRHIRGFYLSISYIFYCMLSYLESVYYYLFKTHLSPSAIFVALDSNSEESGEFLSFYFDNIIFSFTLVFFIVCGILYFRLIKIKSFIDYNKSFKVKFIGLVGFIIVMVFLKFSELIIYNLPYLIVKSTVDYNFENNKLESQNINKFGDFKNVKRTIETNEKEIYVVIIGESTSRSHMGLYNYYRNTTPNLDSIKNDLLVYNDVISPHAYTVGSLTKILTLGNYEEPDKVYSGSIIQLLNSAGFGTYWLSNQRPIGPYESMVTKISLAAKSSKFLTTDLAKLSKVLDGSLIDEFSTIVQNQDKKKVIFVHLMGTHHNYDNRYPDSYNVFKEEPKSNFKSIESTTKINHYDNAVLYNDFVISSLIKMLKTYESCSLAVYFSDHGEEMYDDINLAGHNEDIYSKKMFEVPFFIWESKKYKELKELEFNCNRKYMLDDLFHSLSDLMGVSADEVDLKRSIFSNSFRLRKRIIKKQIDFDTFYE